MYQSHYDLVPSPTALTLAHLGVKPTPISQEIDSILLAHRAEQQDRFIDAAKIKREATAAGWGE